MSDRHPHGVACHLSGGHVFRRLPGSRCYNPAASFLPRIAHEVLPTCRCIPRCGACLRRRRRRITNPLDRIRQYRRGLLPARGWSGAGVVASRARLAGDCRGDRRIDRQSQAGGFGALRHRIRDGRCRLGRLRRQRQVRRSQAAAAHAHGPVSEPDACRDRRRNGHRDHEGPRRQACLARLARRRHRSLGAPHPRHLRTPRQDQARAALGQRVGQCPEGPQDRRVLLGRWRADCGGHRSRGDTRREGPPARSRRGRRRAQQEVRAALQPQRDPEVRVSRHGEGRQQRECLERARRERGDAR